MIDEDIHGWVEENHDLLKPYHTIIKVGDNSESPLSKVILSYKMWLILLKNASFVLTG